MTWPRQQNCRHVEVFAKNEAGHWVMHKFGADAECVERPSVSAELEIAALYENAKLEHKKLGR